MATVTKPMALDETLQATNTALGGIAKDTSLQATNTALGLLGKDASLQAIVTALANIGLNTIGNLAQLTTDQKTSLVAAINELNAGKIDVTQIGVASGVAELDANGKVLSSQLPAFVDDVVEGYYKASDDRFYEESTYEHMLTPESGKSWVDVATNKSYRWTGSVYVRVDEGVQLGETSDTAYRGDRGKTAYLHATDASRVTTAKTTGLYKVGATSEGHVAKLTPVVKADITTLGIPAQDTTYSKATSSADGLMSKEDFTKLTGISAGATKTESSATNGHIEIDDADVTVYDDTEIKNALSTDTTEVEGNPLNFSTLSAQTAESTIVDLEPIQDLHGYDKPWVGGAGKNKLKNKATQSSTSGGVTFTPNSDGSIYCSGNVTNAAYTCTINEAFILPVGDYVISGFTSAVGARVYFYDSSNTEISRFEVFANPVTFSVSSNVAKIRVNALTGAVGSTTNLTLYPQIEQGSQSTSFAPYTNICPISGRTEIGILGRGESIIPNETDTSKGYISGAYLKSDGTTGGTISNFVSEYFDIKGGVAYVLYDVTHSANAASVCFYDENKAFISGVAIERTTKYINAPQNAKYARCTQFINIAEDEIVFAYGSNDLTINLGQTVYGGTLDVENGVLVVEKAIKVLNGTENWTKSSNPNILQGRAGYWCDKNVFPDCVLSGGDGNPNNVIIIFDCFNGNGQSANSAITQTTFYIGVGISTDKTNLWINVDATEFPNVNDFKTWLASNNIQCVYPLATPITINLTPHTINLLKGVNNISTDGDKITLTYRDGSVATLGDLTSAVDNLDSKIDESKILTDTVTGDKYILVVTNGVLDIQQVSN